MKNTMAVRNLIASLFAGGLLLYFMYKTTSPKVIFVPFLFCSLSMTGKSIAQILKKGTWVTVFHKLFILGFLLFWFGFLAVAAFISIRDKSYSLLIFSLPFWLVGIYLTKNKLLGKKGSNAASPFRFAFVVSTVLVTIAILAGILLLILGIQRREPGLLFGGAFFVLVAFAFVLGWLSVNGHFEKCKVDVLGLYMGFVLTGIGVGILIWKFSDLGLWILVPALMAMFGVIQIIKCLKPRK